MLLFESDVRKPQSCTTHLGVVFRERLIDQEPREGIRHFISRAVISMRGSANNGGSCRFNNRYTVVQLIEQKLGILSMLQELEIEDDEHEDDADVRYQPSPEPMPKEQQIYTHDDGYQCRKVERDRQALAHLNQQLWGYTVRSSLGAPMGSGLLRIR